MTSAAATAADTNTVTVTVTDTVTEEYNMQMDTDGEDDAREDAEGGENSGVRAEASQTEEGIESVESTSTAEWGDDVPGNSVLGDLIGDAEDADETEDAGHSDESEDLDDSERTGTAEDEEAPVTRAGIPLRGLEWQQEQDMLKRSDEQSHAEGEGEPRPHVFFE